MVSEVGQPSTQRLARSPRELVAGQVMVFAVFQPELSALLAKRRKTHESQENQEGGSGGVKGLARMVCSGISHSPNDPDLLIHQS